MDQHTGEPDQRRPGQEETEHFDAFGTGRATGNTPGSTAGNTTGNPAGSASGSTTGSTTGNHSLPVRDTSAGALGPSSAFGPLGSGDGSEDADSFDAFGTGRVRAALPPASLSPIALPGAADAPPPEAASLFDSTAPLPKVTQRPPRDPLVPDLGSTPGAGSARARRVVAGEYLLTLNPIDGTEIVACPPEQRPEPQRRTPQDRAARIAAARPAPPPGPPTTELPLLEREEERERLTRLLARGRSVRVTGPSGAGRTAVLEAVAGACDDLAPDGVLWLSGYRRSPADLLQELYTVVYGGDGYRPGRAELPALLREVGAVVVVDDLEFGAAALEEVLATLPECAFLMSATPDVPAPAAESGIEEVFLPGLSRPACVDLLQLAAGRPLAEDERAWAADLWFESEGLPLRFVQAGALLRQRDALRAPAEPDFDDSVWENGTPAAGVPPIPDLTGFDDPQDAQPLAPPTAPPLPAADVPLPSLAESAAPAVLLASRLGESAREALAFAVALDGECPHPSHLPALVGDTHGDAALGELTAVGLAVPVASHYRLAAGIVPQLAAALAADGELTEVQAHSAALHYSWWAGHPSVAAERVALEAEAIIAALAACRDGGNASAAVLLARTVAPVFAVALHWGAWERALRIGQEAARLSGEVAEEAYFHHELGVLALCTGNHDRARAELEASIALRGALADRQGSVVGRRTLALVNDVAPQALPAPEPLLALEAAPAAAPAETTLFLPEPVPPVALISPRPHAQAPAHATPPGRLALLASRRNLVAAGTGVVLAGVLGTIVTLGATSNSSSDTPNQVKPIESVQQDAPDTTTAPPEDATTASPPPTTASTSASPSGSPSTTSASPASTLTDGGLSTPPDTPSAPASSRPPAGGTSGGSGSGGTSTTGGTGGHGTSGGTTGGTASGGTTAGGTSGGPTTSGGTSTGTSGGTTTTGGTSTGSTTGGSTGGSPTSGGTSTGTTGSPTDGGTSTGSTGTPTDGGTTTGTTSGGTTTP
ncbi:ATP-binding protein [Actinacidiphila acididurans]|uniref:ATP-binding protein n=1 Tax=Actinacidiphila acididurans TaxID=2784346 RepID=A0ABS2TP04_9ACTN|nr:ATP-binding protein [Actinacidiphila acididurans]MBM9503708.1 ATP-binding protein [Actinacidiphila acididurans]